MASKPENAASAAARTDTVAPPVARGGATIILCSSCRAPDQSDARPRPGELLADAVRAANDLAGLTVTTVDCLGNCKRRLSAALVTPGCWTYVFGDLTVDNAGDLVEGARLMGGSTDGFMPWRPRPDCLKRGVIARIPPLNSDA